MTRNEPPLTCARRGAKLLDKTYGAGWRRWIKRRRLDLGSGGFDPSDPESCGCVFAQIDAHLRGTDGYYGRMAYAVDPVVPFDPTLPYDREKQLRRHGFAARWEEYPELTDAWRRVLREGPR